MNLSEVREVLLNNPSKEFLIEIVNAAQVPNPLFKTIVYMAMQKMSDADVLKFSRIAVVAIQYIELGDTDGLNNLIKRAGVPEPFASVINNYASYLPKQ